MENKKIVLITGANRGLGFHLAKKLASKYDLILTARSIEAIKKASEIIQEEVQNSKILIHQLDVSNDESIQNLKNWLINENIQLDVLVNNAGVGLDGSGEDIFNTNLKGVINVSEQLISLLNDDGKVLIVSSNMGELKLQSKEIQDLLSQPKTKEELLNLGYDLIQYYKKTGEYGKWTNFQFKNKDAGFYLASKALVTSYGRYVLSKLVKVNQSVYILNPGWVQTDMGGQDATGTLDDGVFTSLYLIQTLPFERNEQYHGKYFNNIAKVDDY